MDYQKAIEVLMNFDSQVTAKADGAYQSTIGKIACVVAISAIQELQALHEQGISLERLKDIDFRKEIIEHINYETYMSVKGELEDYQQIGTLDEVREAVEKQKKKKPCASNRCYVCPHCGLVTSIKIKHNYCDACGQHIDWSEKE